MPKSLKSIFKKRPLKSRGHPIYSSPLSFGRQPSLHLLPVQVVTKAEMAVSTSLCGRVTFRQFPAPCKHTIPPRLLGVSGRHSSTPEIARVSILYGSLCSFAVIFNKKTRSTEYNLQPSNQWFHLLHLQIKRFLVFLTSKF